MATARGRSFQRRHPLHQLVSLERRLAAGPARNERLQHLLELLALAGLHRGSPLDAPPTRCGPRWRGPPGVSRPASRSAMRARTSARVSPRPVASPSGCRTTAAAQRLPLLGRGASPRARSRLGRLARRSQRLGCAAVLGGGFPGAVAGRRRGGRRGTRRTRRAPVRPGALASGLDRSIFASARRARLARGQPLQRGEVGLGAACPRRAPRRPPGGATSAQPAATLRRREVAPPPPALPRRTPPPGARASRAPAGRG